MPQPLTTFAGAKLLFVVAKKGPRLTAILPYCTVAGYLQPDIGIRIA